MALTRPWPSKATASLWPTLAKQLVPFLMAQTLFAWLNIVVALAYCAYTNRWATTFPEPAVAALASSLDLWLAVRRKLHPVQALIGAIVVVPALLAAVSLDGAYTAYDERWYDTAWRLLLVKIAFCSVLAGVYVSCSMHDGPRVVRACRVRSWLTWWQIFRLPCAGGRGVTPASSGGEANQARGGGDNDERARGEWWIGGASVAFGCGF